MSLIRSNDFDQGLWKALAFQSPILPAVIMDYEDWLAWADALIYMQWERPLDPDWNEFRADWARDLLEGGIEL